MAPSKTKASPKKSVRVSKSTMKDLAVDAKRSKETKGGAPPRAYTTTA